MNEQFEYRGYRIMCFQKSEDHDNMLCSWAKAYVRDEFNVVVVAICEKTQVAKMFASSHLGATDENEIWKKLRFRTIAKIKARIDFALFDFGKEYVEVLQRGQIQDNSEQSISIPNVRIEYDILSALKRIREKYPDKYKLECLEIAGYAYINQMDLTKIVFAVDLMLERGLVDHNTVEQFGLADGGFYIKANGLDYLEKLKNKSINSTDSKNTVDIPRNSIGIYEYDVALSFAGEDREYVKDIADQIKTAGFKVFYDKYEEVELWGQDLYQKFHEVFSKRARFCVIFVSKHYVHKVWTKHELGSAQERALKEKIAYILPVRFDDTEVPGLLNTVGYFDARLKNRNDLVKLILAKLNTVSKLSSET